MPAHRSGVIVALVFLPACSGEDRLGGLGAGDGEDTGGGGSVSADSGPSADFGFPPFEDAGVSRDLGDFDRGEGFERLCNANCDLLACVDPEAGQSCRENCDSFEIPGLDSDRPGCIEASEELAECLENRDCTTRPDVCRDQTEQLVEACSDAPPPPPDPSPQLVRFCEASCDLTGRCIFPVPNCTDPCLRSFEGDTDAPACGRALENAARCLDETTCAELIGGEPPCVVELGLIQFACQ
ncbi:MAG: hypothetical protein AAGJ19_03870 [Myxococcota bacterium]